MVIRLDDNSVVNSLTPGQYPYGPGSNVNLGPWPGSGEVNPQAFDEDYWAYNSNVVTASYCGCDPEAVGKAIKKAFLLLTYADFEGVDLDTSGVNDNGIGVGKFNPTGFGGFFNNWIAWGGGVAGTHNVTFLGSGALYDQVAITNGGHGLVGIRRWEHTNTDTEGPDYSTLLWTSAHETYNNVAGRVGVEASINRVAVNLHPLII